MLFHVCFPPFRLNSFGSSTLLQILSHTHNDICYTHRNGVVFEVVLCLSALAGCLGLDRCYLGYPTLGFLKFTTCGGFLAWWLLDLVLIAAQIVGPADGSSYVITTSVPRLLRHVPQNHTVFV